MYSTHIYTELFESVITAGIRQIIADEDGGGGYTQARTDIRVIPEVIEELYCCLHSLTHRGEAEGRSLDKDIRLIT